MSRSMISPRLARAARCCAGVGIAGAALAGAGCGGIGPGDYVLYRVSLSAPSYGSDCELDLDDEEDTSTVRQTATFVLYAGPEDTYYLDTGTLTYEGVEEGDGYEFSGTTVDVEYIGDTDKGTATSNTTVSVVIDGASITGSIQTHLRTRYECADPTQCLQDTNCSQSLDFVGTEIEDLELQHDPA